MPKKEKKYVLEVSEKQSRVLWDALELFCWIHLGKWEECANYSVVPSKFYSRCKTALREIAFDFRATPSLNGHYGIACKKVSNDARIAFDLNGVISHFINFDVNPNVGMTVGFDAPSHKQKDVPLAEMKRK